MATQEFIRKRIEGKEKELARLEKKLERVLKAQASGWEDNPYYYEERDIRITNRDIEACRKALADYGVQLQAQIEKDGSRNVKVILDFLEAWKARVYDHYKKALPEYLEARKEWFRYDSDYVQFYNYGRRDCSKDEILRRSKEHDTRRKEFYSSWAWLTRYMKSDELDDSAIKKDLDRDANEKYDFIIERTNAIVGRITDAANLRIGNKGDLNGFIIGDKGKAKVQTIGAGGYNIQCYHFRTLINAA